MSNMNTLLVVGNGFDLAHGMKTGYKDMLYVLMSELAAWNNNIDFTLQQQNMALCHKFDSDMIQKVLNIYDSYWEKNDEQKIEQFKEINLTGELGSTYHQARDFLFMFGNWWLRYFFDVLIDRRRRIGTGWIDFEAEIHRVITNIENLLLHHSCEEDLEKSLGGYANDLTALREQFIPKLKIDLKILNAYIESYLNMCEVHDEKHKLPLFTELENVKGILSYNYTHTYQNLYDKDMNNVFYLHGEIGKHNIVLGTDETLPDEMKDNLLDCASFKKLYQLIYYRLGNSFKRVISQSGASRGKWNAMIYGHSLTPADKYSLGWLFSKSQNNLFADYIKQITIYYYDEVAYNEQLVNLFKIIGQESVLYYTTNGAIEFEPVA